MGKLEILRLVGGLAALLAATSGSAVSSIDLGTAGSFAVLGGSTVTNTGPTVVNGNLGVWPGTAITGFPPGIVTNGSTEAGTATAQQAQSDLTMAYVAAAGALCGTNLTGQDLGGLTLTAGSYCFDTSAQLTGTLTLDSEGDDTAVFLFQIGSTLTTASASSVAFINGGLGETLYWQVGSSATLGTGTEFAGNIMALTSITLNTGANISCGRALARNGAVTMDTNQVSIGDAACGSFVQPPVVPEPAAWAMMIAGFGVVGAAARRRRKLVA